MAAVAAVAVGAAVGVGFGVAGTRQERSANRRRMAANIMENNRAIRQFLQESETADATGEVAVTNSGAGQGSSAQQSRRGNIKAQAGSGVEISHRVMNRGVQASRNMAKAASFNTISQAGFTLANFGMSAGAFSNAPDSDPTVVGDGSFGQGLGVYAPGKNPSNPGGFTTSIFSK